MTEMMQTLKLRKLYNEWLATQGLFNLSDQPKQGDICNLCGDSKKKKEKEDVTKNTVDDKNYNIKTDDSTSNQNKQNVNLTEKFKGEKVKSTT